MTDHTGRRMTGAFRHRNFRVWFAVTVITGAGSWMHWVAQDWLVLERSDGSALALGIVTALQTLPFLVLGPLGGALADRFSRWRILLVTQAGIVACGAVLGVLALTGTATVWNIGVLALCSGLLNAVYQPTAQSFVPEVVPSEDVAGAVGACAGSFHAARLIGAGLGGLLIAATSVGMVLLLAASVVIKSVLLMFWLNRRALLPAPMVAGRALVRDGLRYVVRQREILLVFGVVFFVAAFALNSQFITALMATQAYGEGASEFGLLGASVAVGSLLGGFVLARRGRVDHRIVVVAAMTFCALQGVSALAPSYGLFAIALVPVGIAQVVFVAAAAATLQLTAEPAMRGRVMALYLVILMGSRPLGSVLLGWTAEVMNPRMAVVATAALLPLVGVLGVVALLRGRLGAAPEPELQEAV